MTAPLALLVGSVPFSSTDEVLSTASAQLGSRLQQIPDGETAHRSNFIAWQHGVFPITIVQPRWGGQPSPETLGKEYTVGDLKPTGYDDAALESYKIFLKLREDGTIASDVRFQVCLPSPLSVVKGFVEGDDCCLKIEPLYEELLLRALRNIQDRIPASDLSIQFDMPNEIAALEAEQGRLTDSNWTPYFEPVSKGVFDRIKRLSAAVDKEVDLGLHLCYGDLFHTHFIQPTDTALLTDFANALVRDIGAIHRLKYIHMPVPKDRLDDAYYEPLKKLQLNDTQLYLGLVHPHDSEGTEKRIQVAKGIVQVKFGLATECGMGRCSAEEAKSVLEIIAAAV